MPTLENTTETQLTMDLESEAGDPARGPGKFSRVWCYSDKPGVLIKNKKYPEGMPIIVKVADYIAKHLGMDVLESIPRRVVPTTGDASATGNLTVYYRGSMGAGSIKVPMMEGGGFKESTKGHRRHLSIPMPAGATLGNITEFLNTEIKSNKPPYFISKGGRRYPLGGN